VGTGGDVLPDARFGGPEDIDIWSVKKWRDGASGNYARLYMAEGNEKPGLGGHPQADSLGDRGEFDRDNSGGGKLYAGVFDRKLHLSAPSGARGLSTRTRSSMADGRRRR